MNQILIKGGALIDGEKDDVIKNGSILIKEGIIQEISTKAVSTSSKTEIIDATGCTVLPGLIDCHVHLTWSGGPDPVAEVKGEPDSLLAIRALENAASF